MDIYLGSPYDPQSLHKYAYVHCNPINSIDPSGNMQFSLTGMLMTATIVGMISGITAGAITAISGGTSQQILNAMLRWFLIGLIGFAAGAIVYGGIWALHSILVAVYGAGAGFGSLEYARQYGIRSYNELRELLRGTGLHAHHIVEGRFAQSLGLKANEMARSHFIT